ncbi:hypothetical protein F2Q68_00004430 [Brassica cretica]|uniref:Uncharacterized protein n=1 Tax=Brassica cretica TaxID=69181 RepID=A0A8S9J923_BRACR|nr:hypothetical protein F2Q68_00004430 [Brassica cretica]
MYSSFSGLSWHHLVPVIAGLSFENVSFIRLSFENVSFITSRFFENVLPQHHSTRSTQNNTERPAGAGRRTRSPFFEDTEQGAGATLCCGVTNPLQSRATIRSGMTNPLGIPWCNGRHPERPHGAGSGRRCETK